MCHGHVAIAVRAALEAVHQCPRRNSILKERLSETIDFRLIYRKNTNILLEYKTSVYFSYVHIEKGKMSPKYRHEPEARGTQVKNYPSP